MTRTAGEKIGRFVEDYLPEALSFVGLLGIAAVDVFNVESKVYFIVFAVAWLVSIYLTVHRKNSTNSLLDQLDEQKSTIDTLRQALSEGNRNFYEVWNDRARSLFQEFGLSKYDRISIYKFDSRLNEFRLLGRFAENHEYRKRTRYLYPVNVGVIGKAWEHGEHYEKSLPNPEKNFEKFAEQSLSKYGLSLETCKKLTMKSTCLWAKSLSNEKDIPFGLVVVESAKRESLDQVALTEFFDGQKRLEIENLLDHLEFMEPNLRLAQEMGF
ncbi:hypothetical protein [Roseibium sp.]|uniref:hypothetical protein n=1 Tax=Roseibium sp. TaxID=1936156 RepID=UPI003BAC0215